MMLRRKVTMKTTSASPERVLLAGKTYSLPKAFADELVEGKFAIPAKSDVKLTPIPSKPDPGDQESDAEPGFDDDED